MDEVSSIAHIPLGMCAIADMDPAGSLMLLGIELRRRRQARGLTQAQLAARARLSRAVVIRAEKGDRTIAIGNVAKLLWVVGEDLDARASRYPTLEEA